MADKQLSEIVDNFINEHKHCLKKKDSLGYAWFLFGTDIKQSLTWKDKELRDMYLNIKLWKLEEEVRLLKRLVKVIDERAKQEEEPQVL